MKALHLLSRFLVRLEMIFLVVFLGLMVILAFAQVVMRNLFDTGFLWGDPLVRQMVMWSGFMGAAIAASEDRHISIDALTKFLSERLRHIVQIFTNLFAGVVCYYLAQAAWTFLLSEKESGGELITGIPSWIGLVIIPTGYILLSAHFLINAVDHAAGAVTRPAKEAA